MTRRSGPDAELRVGLPREVPSSVTADAICRNPVAPSTRCAAARENAGWRRPDGSEYWPAPGATREGRGAARRRVGRPRDPSDPPDDRGRPDLAARHRGAETGTGRGNRDVARTARRGLW